MGVKANNASGVAFTDVTAYAEAETNVWGADLFGSDSRLVRVDATAVGNPGTFVYGARCISGTAEVHDSLLRAGPAGTGAYGLFSSNCAGTVGGSELSGDTNGFYGSASAGTVTMVIRDSFLSGASSSVHTVSSGIFGALIVHSTLDGGGGSSASATDVQECTAVTYNSGGAEMFQATTADPCP